MIRHSMEPLKVRFLDEETAKRLRDVTIHLEFHHPGLRAAGLRAASQGGAVDPFCDTCKDEELYFDDNGSEPVCHERCVQLEVVGERKLGGRIDPHRDARRVAYACIKHNGVARQE